MADESNLQVFSLECFPLVCVCVCVCVCVLVCVGVCQGLTGCLSLSLPHTMAGVGREDFMKLMQHSEIPGPER